VIAVEENYCRNCAHFQQHYTFDKRRIFRVYCGHCTFGRAKKKLPDAKGCVNFTYANCDENAFVTKEYLSKELLQYLLNLYMFLIKRFKNLFIVPKARQKQHETDFVIF